MTATKEQQNTLPDYVDEAARTTPNDTWAVVPRSTTGFDEGWQYFTYRDLANAVNRLAWWIEKNIGVAKHPGQTIGYLGGNDLRYMVVLAATLKTGYVILFNSPRNSLEGQKFVLTKTNCEVFMFASETAKQVEEIQKVVPNLRTAQAPTIHELFDQNATALPYEGRHSRDIDARSVILHTSGSTGLPKPIYWTVGSINVLKAQASLGDEENFKQVPATYFADRRLMFVIAPFFHAMGIFFAIRSFVGKGPIATPPSGKVFTADLVISGINSLNPAMGVMPPSILEDMTTTEEGLKALGKLEYVFFGGGPLAKTAGDRASKVTKITNCMGSTEALNLAILFPSDAEDWEYFHWSSTVGAHMDPVEDGLHELVLKRKDLQYQGIFHNFPELQEYRTKDLFKRHPTKPYLWKHSGRRDDVVVLSNGEKFNPISMERIIGTHPLVRNALVVGTGKFQAGLLIEPEWSQLGDGDLSALVDQIWPNVEQANRDAPSHAKIHRSKIAFAEKGKHFVLAPKGTIIRSQTVAAFRNEIEALYTDEGYSSDPNRISGDETDLTTRIHRVFSRTLSSFDEETPDDVDIFSLGVDSLDVLELANALNKAIRGATVNATLIYSNPSVKQLVEVLSKSTQKQSDQKVVPLSREERMDRMVRKYTKDMIRQKSPTKILERPLKHTVILTGSTGSLGTQMLEQLLKDANVEKVYCLNRSDNAESRQKDAFSRYNHDTTNFSKAEFLKTDFASDHFGLSDEIYERLLSTVTIFIHAAWSVDFNLSLESYEATHIAGTRRAVDFAAVSAYTAPIIFISSVASIGMWDSITQDGSAVPETTTSLFDNALALPQGYGESKHVASQILATASHRLGINTAIVRAGQLAGPSTRASGAEWNKHEWLPTLVHTSKILGKLPKVLGSFDVLDWIPMDVAAGAVIDIAKATTAASAASERTQVYHLANPYTASWAQLYPVIQRFYADAGVTLEVVEYEEWVEQLKDIPLTKENAERVPGLKLVEFYDSMRPRSGIASPMMETKRTEECSKTVRDGTAVDGEVVRKWLGQWGF